MSVREQFEAKASRLADVLGGWVPTPSEHLHRQADHLLANELLRLPDGRGWLKVDPETVDWSGQGTAYPYGAQWMLQCFALLGPLAATYRHTRDERYAACARRYLDIYLRRYPVAADWCPAPGDGATAFPGRIGVSRHAGWLGSLPAFTGSAAFDDAFVVQLFEASRHTLNYLMGHLYPGRNIRILHGDALLLNSLRLDAAPEAAAWRETGVRILNDAVARQVLPDGADMEGSPEYHWDVLELLTHTWRLAQAYPELGLRIPTDTLAAMFDYGLAVCRPDGHWTALNDSSYIPPQAGCNGRWMAAREAFLRRAGRPVTLPPTSRHFAHVGQVFLRDAWTPDATYLTFDATARHGWHWHPSRNSIQLYAGGRPLLVDTGYPCEGDLPAYGSMTMHHSTLSVNGWNQVQTPATARLRQTAGYDLVEGLYSGGYWVPRNARHGAGVFGEHHRALLWIRGRCVVVLDHLHVTAEPSTRPVIESVWHFSEGDAGTHADGRAVSTQNPDSNLLLLFPLVPPGLSLSLHKGEYVPRRGWVPNSSRTGYVPAPMARLSGHVADPWKMHLATVLVPFTGVTPPAVAAAATAPGHGFHDRTAGRLDLRWPDGATDTVLWSGRLEDAIDRQHGVDTDAALLHLQFAPDGQLVSGLAVDATFLRREAQGAEDLLPRLRHI